MRLLIGILLITLGLLSTHAPATAAAQQRFHASVHTTPTRLLFVGNSYLYYNDSLHNHVERIAAELKPELREQLIYKSATIGGARLDQHNLDWLLGVGNIGVAEPFELVVLQGGSFEVLNESNRARFTATVARHAAKIRAIGGEPALYMTHAYVPPHRRAKPNLTPTILSTYQNAAAAINATLIPVGLAFDRSYQERPEFSLHAHFDGTHPNLRGTYLGACVVYLTLYGGNLDALEYDYFGLIPKAEARYLRRIAQATVDTFFTAQD